MNINDSYGKMFSNEDALNMLSSGPDYVTKPTMQPDRTGRVEVGVSPAEPTLAEETGAAFRRSNLIGSYLLRDINDYDYDENYNPIDDIKGYEEYTGLLMQAMNKPHADEIKRRIDQERIDDDILARGGASAVAISMAAGVLDPTILVPGVSILKGARALRAIKSGVATGATVGGAVAVQEAGLQATQLLRTREETNQNIMAGTILGGLFGATFSAVRAAPEFRAMRQSVKSDLSAQIIDINDVMRRNNYDVNAIKAELGESVGAAKISTAIDAERIAAKGKAAIVAGETISGAAGIEKVVKKITPLLRTLNSPYLKSRLIIQKLINNPLALEKNKLFQATEQSVENLKQIYEGKYLSTQQNVLKTYKDYKSAGGPTLPFTRNNVVNEAKKKLGKSVPESSFLEEVGKALKRNDEHPVPAVASAAKEYRKLFNEIGNEAVRSGVWSKLPDRKTAESYFSRMFDTDAITENLPEFKAIVKDWVAEETEKSVSRIEAKYAKQEYNLQSEIDHLKISQFRKASFLQDQAEIGGKPYDLTIEDAKVSLELLAQGKPKKPQSIIHAIGKIGINSNDQLIKNIHLDAVKLWNKSNFQKLSITKDGGKYLYNLSFDLWERGYFPTHVDAPPTADELVEIINDALRGKDIVHPDDYTALEDYYYFLDAEEVISKMGIKPKEYKGGKILLTDEALKDFREKLIFASEASSRIKIKELEADIARLEARKAEELSDIKQLGVDGYAAMVTDEIVDNIRGMNLVSPEFDFSLAERGPLKAQKFLIPDSRIEKFTVNDASVIAERYARLVGTDIELMNKFGSTKLEDILVPLKREYDEAAINLKGKEAKKAKEQYEADVRDIEASYQLLRGIYPDNMYSKDTYFRRLGRIALAYNYMRMLGNVALASVPDIGKQVAYNGFVPFMRDGMIPLIKAMPKIMKGIRPRELEELKFAAKTIQHLNNSRAMTMADMGNRYGSRTGFDNFLNASTKAFSRSVGIVEWNNMMEALAGLMSQRRIARNLLDLNSGKQLAQKEREFLSAIGIGKKEAERLGAMFKKHSEIGDDFIYANSQKWEDIDAVKIYRSALNKDIGSVLIEKQIGDVPLFANTATGQIVMQFKNFMFASLNKTLFTSLQRRDMAALQGAITMIGMGSLAYIATSYSYGKEPDLTPENLVIQGLDRSGLMSIFGEINNTAERVGFPGIHRFAGAPQSSRYAAKSIPEAVLGPSVGTIANIGLGIHAFAQEGELSDSDRKQIRKLVPWNNWAAMMWIMQTADEDTRRKLGYN